MIAADRIAPAIVTPIDADTRNAERMLYDIVILHASVGGIITYGSPTGIVGNDHILVQLVETKFRADDRGRLKGDAPAFVPP
jgi:hypothetical protein